MRTDTLFYQLFQTCPETLFELLGQDPNLAKSYEFSSREVKQLAFRLDGLFLPTQSGLPLYFVEVQFQWDPQFYYRFLAEIYLYLRQYQPQRPWYAVVIYPHGSLDPGLPADLAGSDGQMMRLYLDEQLEVMSPDDSLVMAILRLVIAPPKHAEQRGRELIARSQGISGDVLELVKTMMIYKFVHKSHQEIEAMFGLSELKQTRVYQEGRQEGQQLGEARLALRVLRQTLGSLPETLEAEVYALSTERLEDLAEQLLEFHSITDLQTWLNQR